MAIDKETVERAKAWANGNLKKAVEQKEDKPVAKKPTDGRDYSNATKIAVKVIRSFEGCNLYSYPDPASELYKALSAHGLLKKFMNGTNRSLPEGFEKLDGSPFTIGYGQTKGVTIDTILTQEEAESDLFDTVAELVGDALKTSPRLSNASDEAIAAVVSLLYNIGIGNYSQSTVCKKIDSGETQAAGDAFLLWDKAKGQVLQGLVKRRQTERALFLSVTQ